jgi:ribosomal protein S6--L-glutamate ligase
MNNKKSILILGARNVANRRILHEVKKIGHNCMIVDPQHFIVAVSDQTNGNDKIYYKGKRIYKNKIDYVINRAGSNFHIATKVVEHFTNNLGIPCSSTSLGMIGASDKFLCSQILSQAKIKTPKSVYFQNSDEFHLLIKLAGGLPVVAKLITGSQGAGVFILNDVLAGSTALSTISKSQQVVLQQYIETATENAEKCDIRAFVVGGEVVAAMKRFSVRGDFRSNYSISKNAKKVKLTDEQRDLAIRSAAALNLDVCGVDIVEHAETGVNYVIEANSNSYKDQYQQSNSRTH